MLRIGLAQLDVKPGDREANFAAAEEWMKKYWTPSETETAVVLPELFDVGYVIDEAGKYADKDAERAAGFLSRLAREYGVWFAGGSVLAMTDAGAVNRALVVNPLGEYVTHYDKAHLVPMMEEDKYLRSGSEFRTFEIGGAKCALAICYDLRFCEWFRMGALAGAQVFFISAEWPRPRIEHWRLLLRARAVENMMYIAACNRVGDTPADSFPGYSAVIDPWGAALCEAGEAPFGAFVEIDPQKAEEARRFIKTLEMRRGELYRL
ncbi:carbon-nitrogen family hydrolase [Cloacibacillus sp. An23]|uniref:carbon-nitrogen family hydrolase n=1 Tax=Cloacibacillus sp. An23 TaxID=1965591 RepID=UPI000B37F6F1|nr:carbon-nitrogen family hydrolase [Cloacibacillus sp. An23]OUO93473.1 carbon-nitrogen hydrolase [Cloacibacillus sp. An23]